jgi:hypothetical protein
VGECAEEIKRLYAEEIKSLYFHNSVNTPFVAMPHNPVYVYVARSLPTM